MKKNCHNCIHGHWDNDSMEPNEITGDYFVCEVRNAHDDVKLENNLCRPEYLEKSKVCCKLTSNDIGVM